MCLYTYVWNGQCFYCLFCSIYISQWRGLTGVAYPLWKAMREPEAWDKQRTDFPRLFFVIPIPYYIYRLNREIFSMHTWRSMIHIGHIIRQELRNKGYTLSWLARELNCSRSNVYKFLDKASLDTSLLMQISLLVGVDFFRYYTDELNKREVW